VGGKYQGQDTGKFPLLANNPASINIEMSRLIRKLHALFNRLDQSSNGWLGDLRQSVERFVEMRGAEAAAGMAYYALFSMFPLTLFFLSVLGFIIGSEQAYRQTFDFMQTVFPFSGDFIQDNLVEVLEQRGTIGIVAALGLLWAASGFFTILARNVNRAWPSVKLRGAMQGRLVAFGMIGVLSLLLLLSLLSTTLINLLPRLVEATQINEAVLDSLLLRGILRLIPALFTFMMFAALYRWVPNRKVQWKAVFIGAFIVTIVWELAKSGFALYLASGWVTFEIVYGPLGTLIALMVWIYFSNLLTLFGSYLVAAVDIRAEQLIARREYEARMMTSMHKGVRG
jgi:membrane protein